MGLLPHDLITPKAPSMPSHQELGLNTQIWEDSVQSLAAHSFSACTATFSPCLGWAKGRSDRHLPRVGGMAGKEGLLPLIVHLSQLLEQSTQEMNPDPNLRPEGKEEMETLMCLLTQSVVF